MKFEHIQSDFNLEFPNMLSLPNSILDFLLQHLVIFLRETSLGPKDSNKHQTEQMFLQKFTLNTPSIASASVCKYMKENVSCKRAVEFINFL